MIEKVPVLKDENNQTLVPAIWRDTFKSIADALKDGDFNFSQRVRGGRSVSERDASIITSNIREYGDQLVALPDDTWNTSACQWMLDYWDVYIDLFTLDEGASDLVLAIRVYENGEFYTFEVQSVYVP